MFCLSKIKIQKGVLKKIKRIIIKNIKKIYVKNTILIVFFD